MRKKNAQTLITLLVFAATSLLVIGAVVMMIIINSSAASKFEQGAAALLVTESGAENAILRLLRDPSYGGETLSVGDGTVTVTVTPGPGEQKIISADGQLGDFKRKIQVIADYAGNVLTILSWKEV